MAADSGESLRARLYDLLEETERSSPTEKILNFFLVSIIVTSVASVTLETLNYDASETRPGA